MIDDIASYDYLGLVKMFVSFSQLLSNSVSIVKTNEVIDIQPRR